MCDQNCENACFVAWMTGLVRTERPRLVAIARAEGLGDAEALDAVQDGLITFIGLPAAKDGGGRMLSAVVRNAARNARRKHHHAKPHDDEAVDTLPGANDDVVAKLARAEDRVAMSACVAELGAGA